MALHTINPTQTKAWEKLQNHFAALQSVTMQELFLKDANRAEQFNIIWNDFLFQK
jgi:glucose-6-phosphate isomerase